MTESHAVFTVAYDGEALRDGTMDVRELAPALLSIGALCERANEVLNGDRATVAVRVKADFQRGSFTVDLQCIQILTSAVESLPTIETIEGVNAILSLLGIGSLSGGVVGLYKLIKWLKGRKPAVEEADSDDLVIKVGETEIRIPREVWGLYRDRQVRRHLEGSVAPLRREGIEEMRFLKGEGVAVEVEEDEVPFFQAKADDQVGTEIVPESTAIYAFEIAKVPLKAGLKWRLRNDSMRIAAELEDAKFQNEMDAGRKAFKVGDALVVRMRTRTTQDDEGKIRTEHWIEEVLDHRQRAASNQTTFLDGSEPGSTTPSTAPQSS